MASRFRVVSLDAGETIVHPRPSFAEAFTRICRDGGFELEVEQAAEIDAVAAARLLEYQRKGLRFTNSTESSREFWIGLYGDFLAAVGAPDQHLVTLPGRLYSEFTKAHNYALFDDALPAIAALRLRGLKVGVTSNWEPWLERMLVEMEIRSLFDFVVVSGAVGFEKPDRRIYEITLERSGADPSEVIHVGDSLHSDVYGARAIGITPVLLDRQGRHPDADCLRVASLTEMASEGGPLD